MQNGSVNYTYDAENRLVWSSNGYEYIYDGDGSRVVKCTSGTQNNTCQTGSTGTLYWRYSGGDTIAENSLSGTNLEEYIFFGGRRVARRDVSTNIVHYYFPDHLGSASAVTSANGSTLEENLDYYPYGGLAPTSTDTVPQNYKFNGKERDAESGLDEFGARYYAPMIGRFMTPDWAARPTAVPYAVFGDPQSLNLYGFVRNDPVSRADADGHDMNDPPSRSGGVAAAAGAGDISNAITAQDAFENNLQTLRDQGFGPLLKWEAAQRQKAQSQQPNRQPDGSYKATPAQLAKIQEAADKKTTIGNGECVTACERFTGVPGPTSSWKGGKPASELTDKDKGTAIATFIKGSDGEWHYLPDSGGHKNSGAFMGTSTKGTFWMADQWPGGQKPVSIWNVGSNPNNASMNAASYRVIIVQNP